MNTLRVAYHPVGDLPRALQVNEDSGPSPMELLPKLSYIDYTHDPFTSFILARQNAGHPVTLVCHRHATFCVIEFGWHSCHPIKLYDVRRCLCFPEDQKFHPLVLSTPQKYVSCIYTTYFRTKICN